MAEAMTPGQGTEAKEREGMLRRIAKLAKQQGSFHLACKKYTQVIWSLICNCKSLECCFVTLILTLREDVCLMGKWMHAWMNELMDEGMNANTDALLGHSCTLAAVITYFIQNAPAVDFVKHQTSIVDVFSAQACVA